MYISHSKCGKLWCIIVKLFNFADIYWGISFTGKLLYIRTLMNDRSEYFH